MVRCTRYNIMWLSLSVTCSRSVGSLCTLASSTNKTDHHDEIVESGIKHPDPIQLCQWLIADQWCFSDWGSSVVFWCLVACQRFVNELLQVDGYSMTWCILVICQWLETAWWFLNTLLNGSGLSMTWCMSVVCQWLVAYQWFFNDMWLVADFSVTFCMLVVYQWLVVGFLHIF